MVCEALAAAAPVSGAADCGPSSGSQEAAAALNVAYGAMSAFACDLGALLAGTAAAEQAQAVMAEFLADHQMAACLDLLLHASDLGSAGTSEAADSAADAADCGSGKAGSSQAQAPAPPTAAAAAVAASGACPSLSTRDLLLGFASARNEAAFQHSKALSLQQQDAWTAGIMFVTTAAPLAVMFRLAQTGYHPLAVTFFATACVWAVFNLMPGAVMVAARRRYLASRGWLWAASSLLSALLTCFVNHWLLPGGVVARLQSQVVTRASAWALLEFVVRPIVLRLSFTQQLLASLASAVIQFHMSQGASDGPHGVGVCLALAALATAISCISDRAARLAWLGAGGAKAAAAAAAAAAGAGAANGAASTSASKKRQ